MEPADFEHKLNQLGEEAVKLSRQLAEPREQVSKALDPDRWLALRKHVPSGDLSPEQKKRVERELATIDRVAMAARALRFVVGTLLDGEERDAVREQPWEKMREAGLDEEWMDLIEGASLLSDFGARVSRDGGGGIGGGKPTASSGIGGGKPGGSSWF